MISLYANKTHRYLIILGVAFFALSFFGLLFFYGRNNLLASASMGLSWLGLLFLFDYVLTTRFHVHFLPSKRSELRGFLTVGLLSIIFCFVLEIAGMYTTRLWRFPYIPFYIYILISPFFYILYTLVLFQLYELIKHFLKHHEKPIKISRPLYERIMKIELVTGLTFLLIWSFYSVINVQRFSIPFWDIRFDSGISVPWWFGFLSMLSLFFIFEWSGHRRGKDTLTSDLLKGNASPIVAIILANTVAILLMEMVNAPFQLWVYSNWFWQDYKLFTLPVAVIILWPTQFLAFLAMFNAFLDKRRTDIW